MPKIFTDFEEIREELKKEAPPVVYKYRTWKDPNHKKLLTMREAWFSHPFDLNDPLDVRPETAFDFGEVEEIQYFEKLKAFAPDVFPDKTPEEQENLARAQWEKTKHNPQHIVDTFNRRVTERDKFDSYGVFSTAKSELIQEVWEKYSDAYRGYCLGFKTMDFCENIKSQYGHIRYNNEPFRYSFFNKDNAFDRLYLKKTQWEYEKEFRFITNAIGRIIDGEELKRVQIFKPSVVAEIVLGHSIPVEDEKEIMEVIQKSYPANLPTYKTEFDKTNTLVKKRIR